MFYPVIGEWMSPPKQMSPDLTNDREDELMKLRILVVVFIPLHLKKYILMGWVLMIKVLLYIIIYINNYVF